MKKRGIIERIVMGKPREKELTQADLPKNRRQQFAYVFRTRFGVIFRANLLAALFWIPFTIWYFMSSAYLDQMVSGMSQTEYVANLFYFSILSDGPLAVFSVLGFVGLAGIYYVIRRVCWGQSVKLISDFFHGVKSSLKQFCLLGVLAGLLNFVLNYIWEFSIATTVSDSELLRWIVVIAAAVLALVSLTAGMFACCHATLYTSTFAGLLKNSFILTFKTLWISLGMAILSLLPILIFVFLPWIVVKLVGACLAAVLSIGFAVTLQTVYCSGVFDKYINAKQHPDYVNMGLFNEKNIDVDENEQIQSEKGHNPSADAPEEGDPQ